MGKKIPKYQITARCLRMGALFRIYLKSINIQRDNVSEFVSMSKKKKSIMENLIEKRCK